MLMFKRSSVFAGLSALMLGTALADDAPSAPAMPVANSVLSIPSGVTAITITTGGGGRIAERDTGFLKRPKGWRMHYVANPAVAEAVNQLLVGEGHDVTAVESMMTPCQRCWLVEEVYSGPTAGYAVFDSTEETRTTVGQRVANSIFAVALTAVVGAATKGTVAYGPNTAHWGNSKHITMEMLEGLPLGASRMLVTRVSNPRFQARQEVLTAVYGNASDEELRKINNRYLVGMLGLKNAPDVSAEEFGGEPYGEEGPTTYVTGPAPAAESAVEGVVASVNEISIDAAAVKGNSIVSPGESLPPPESSVPAWEITYRVGGDSTDHTAIVLKQLLQKISIGDKIKIQPGLFGTAFHRIS